MKKISAQSIPQKGFAPIESGFAHILVLVLLLAGLAAGAVLVQNNTNLFSKAYMPTVSKRFLFQPIPTPTPSFFCDANKDGKIDSADGKFVQGCWNKPVRGDCAKVDTNGDKRIDIRDIQKYSGNCPQIFGASPSGTPTVSPLSFKNAVYFDRNQSPSVNILKSGSIGKFDNLTMEALIKLKENSQIRYSYPIIFKGGPFTYLLDVTPQRKLKFTYNILYQGRWAPVEIESNQTIPFDTWTHVAVLYYTGQPKCLTGQCESDEMLNKIFLYINGKRVATKDQTGQIGGSDSVSGANIVIGDSGLDKFSGTIDEVRISNALQYLGTSFNVPTSPFSAPLGGINSSATLLLCHFDENGGNPTCQDGSGTRFNTIATNITFVSHDNPNLVPTTNPTLTPTPTPRNPVTSRITTSNKSWPTSFYGEYKNGDLRVEYSASRIFNIRYWLEFSGCTGVTVTPGYYTYTGATTSFAQNFNADLRRVTSAQTCTFTFKGTDALGAYVPDASVTVNINPAITPTLTVAVPTPTPTRTPTPNPNPSKRAFVTSITYNGNLGGLSGADTKCQARANAVSLGGTWKAWLSTQAMTVQSRLSHSNGEYKRLDGVVIANNWSDIFNNGGFRNPLNITETKIRKDTAVWTGGYFRTDTDYGPSTSQFDGSSSCGNWTSSAGYDGYIGLSNYTGRQSIGLGTIMRCNDTTAYSLYCFEQ